MLRRIILKIHGNVQGVGYRYQVREYAKEHDITGYVSNNEENGTVLVVAEGEEKDLQNLLNFCYNEIQNANVKSIDVEWENPRGEFKDFEIR